MNCETVREMLWAYLEKEITAEKAVKIEEHLKNCADCREELELQKEMMKTLAGLPDVELPEGYHAELMQKLQAEAAPNVVSFPQKAAQKKKKQPMWKQWGMIAAAVLVVVAAGGMDGLMEMRESQNAAVQEMKVADIAEPMEASVEDVVVAEDEMQKDDIAVYQKTAAPAAGAEMQDAAKRDEAVYDAAALPQMASAETEEGIQFSMTRSAVIEATDKAILLVADTAVAMAELQKAIAEAGGFEEEAEEGSVFAVIPVENYDGFVEAVENIGTLEWTLQGSVEEGAAFRTVEIQLNRN